MKKNISIHSGKSQQKCLYNQDSKKKLVQIPIHIENNVPRLIVQIKQMNQRKVKKNKHDQNKMNDDAGLFPFS